MDDPLPQDKSKFEDIGFFTKLYWSMIFWFRTASIVEFILFIIGPKKTGNGLFIVYCVWEGLNLFVAVLQLWIHRDMWQMRRNYSLKYRDLSRLQKLIATRGQTVKEYGTKANICNFVLVAYIVIASTLISINFESKIVTMYFNYTEMFILVVVLYTLGYRLAHGCSMEYLRNTWAYFQNQTKKENLLKQDDQTEQATVPIV